MDATVLSLYIGSQVLTVGGLISATKDIISRVSTYRDELAKAAANQPPESQTDPIRELFKARASFLVAQDLRRERTERAAGDTLIAAGAGLTASSRRLWISATVAVLGILTGGAADALATIRAP
jgi:hypothetical protein